MAVVAIVTIPLIVAQHRLTGEAWVLDYIAVVSMVTLNLAVTTATEGKKKEEG